VRDYEESDCPHIVQKAWEMGILATPDASSDSYDAFRSALSAVGW